MNILEFAIHNQELSRLDNKILLNKSSNIYKCQFYFDEDSEWINENKFVIFTDGWGNKFTQHLGEDDNVLSCLIPQQVLNGSYFKISVCGGELITTNNLIISLTRSGYNAQCSKGNRISSEHKDMWVEIFTKLDNTVEHIIYDNHCIILKNEDRILQSIYLPFLEEEETRLLINEIINELLPLLDGEVFTSDEKNKLSSVEYGANHTIIDEILSLDSDNPVSNRTITNALNGKEDKYNFIDRIDDLLIELINKN